MITQFLFIIFDYDLLLIPIIGFIWFYVSIQISNKKYELSKATEDFLKFIREYRNDDHYFTGSEMEFVKDSKPYNVFKKTYLELNDKWYIKNDESLSKKALETYDYVNKIDIKRYAHNAIVIQKWRNQYSSFFNNRFEHPLDKQQIDAVLQEEDISSAGSGKSSTIVAKTLHLIENRRISPSKNLLVTFIRKAANEFTQRLNIRGLECKTFHKIAKEIIADNKGVQPNYVDDYNFSIESVFRELLFNNAVFRKNLVDYMLFHMDDDMHPHDFNNSEDYYADRAANNPKTFVPDYYSIKSTKSNQEKMIFHYLYSLGVTFKYESPYEYDVRDSSHRQYKPDFSILLTSVDR